MSIELSHDELLVLYDLIHRLEDAEEIFEDLAERQVLWHIQTQLEKELVERFQTDYIALVTCALYVMYKRRKEKGCPLWSAVTASLFPAYLVSLIGLTLFSRMIGDVYYFMFYHQAPWPVGEGGYQWFSLIYDFKLDFFRDFSAENIGNILLFLPFGMLYPLFRAGSTWQRTLVVGIATSLIIENIQPLMDRSFDINDIVLNGIGVVVSTAAFFSLRFLFTRARR